MNTLTDIALTAQAMKAGGGAERYTRDVVAGLHRMGITPALFARDIDPALEEAAWVKAYPLPVRFVPGKLRNWAFNWQLGRVLQQRRPQCVFAINHSPYADVALCGGTHPGSLAAMNITPGWSDQWQFTLERRTYTNAKKIVAHSQLMQRELQGFYHIAPEKIEVIYPPVDTARFRPLAPEARMQIRRQLGLPEDKALFLFSSTSHERKGYAALEDFFLHTSLPVCLVVAGRSVPRTSDTLRYAGYRTDIENLFAAADFTVVASLYEPFGLVGVESVMCGTPVVIADNVGSAEVILDTSKFAYMRQSPSGLSNAIHAALTRIQSNETRITEPLQHLAYNPDVDVHVSALTQVMASATFPASQR